MVNIGGGKLVGNKKADLTDTPTADQAIIFNSSKDQWDAQDQLGAGGGESNTASNVGTGSGVFKQKTGVDLELRSVIGGTGLTATENVSDITIDHDAHTGDVTGSTALTIAADAVTNAKLNDMANSTIKGRTTAGTGDPEDLTAAQTRTILNVEDGSTADQTDAEIEAAYNNQVAAMSQATAETGTSTTIERVTAQRLRQAAEASSKEVQAQIEEGTTDLAVVDNLNSWGLHISDKLAGMNLVYVHARVVTAGTTGTTDIQIHNVTQAADMLSTKITIDSGETGSDTAATSAVIDTANDDVAENDIIRIDIDAVSTTAPKGLFITMRFEKP